MEVSGDRHNLTVLLSAWMTGEPQGQSGRSDEEKNPYRESNSGRPAR
jgi:hypothetical protein